MQADTFSSYPSNLTAELEEFKKREEELRRREAELNRREATMSSSGYKPPNYPPLPKWFPVQPCFYINIEEEIPPQYVSICKKVYYKLLLYSLTLVLNVLGMIFMVGVGMDHSTVPFVVSIIVFFIIVPLSFLFCFRSAYVALKTKSSFNFIVFFTAYFIESIMHFVQFLGIVDNPWCGFINGAKMLDASHPFGGIFSILVGLMFVGLFFFSLYILKTMYGIYKQSGANLTQAQTEFSTGVWKHGGSAVANQYFGENTRP